MPDDDLEVFEEVPGLLSHTRYWNRDMPNVETIRFARKREEDINEAHREKVKAAGS